MAIVAVQRRAKGAVAASVSIGSADGWATPTAGNLLVFSANSDALVTLSGAGTVTAGPSVIDGNGAYCWWKIATGAETTITGTPSVSDDIVLTAAEYSGVSGFDVQSSSTIASVAGTTTNAAAITTTAAADLICAFALIHSGGPATTPAWTNSFVNVLTADSGTTNPTAQRCTSFAAELLPSGAAGSYSTASSWEGTASFTDRQHLIIAFKASGAPAPPVGSSLVISQAVNRSFTY